jgi:hypothetical protein
MINSYFRSSIKREITPYSPYTSYSTIYSNQQANHKRNRYKIFLIILARATERTLQVSFDQIVAINKKTTQSLTRLVSLS